MTIKRDERDSRQRETERERAKETVKGTGQISLKLPPSRRKKRQLGEWPSKMVKQVVNLIFFLAKAKQHQAERLPP